MAWRSAPLTWRRVPDAPFGGRKRKRPAPEPVRRRARPRPGAGCGVGINGLARCLALHAEPLRAAVGAPCAAARQPGAAAHASAHGRMVIRARSGRRRAPAPGPRHAPIAAAHRRCGPRLRARREDWPGRRCQPSAPDDRPAIGSRPWPSPATATRTAGSRRASPVRTPRPRCPSREASRQTSRVSGASRPCADSAASHPVLPLAR